MCLLCQCQGLNESLSTVRWFSALRWKTVLWCTTDWYLSTRSLQLCNYTMPHFKGGRRGTGNFVRPLFGCVTGCCEHCQLPRFGPAVEKSHDQPVGNVHILNVNLLQPILLVNAPSSSSSSSSARCRSIATRIHPLPYASCGHGWGT